VKLQQQLVQDHVAQQAQEQQLSQAAADKLLAETLQHNGLPQIQAPGSSLLSSFLGAQVTGGAPGGAPDQDDQIPGLPKPGTLEHTVKLALFNAEQSLSNFLSPSSQQAIDNKLGVAAGAGDGGDGGDGGDILTTVAALPQTVGGAAYNLLKFITPPAPTSQDPKPGVTYSEVTTGVNPTYATLGLLGTGALGSVLYSYVATDSHLASSATALALGAVDAIKRNDIVDVATNAIAKITGNIEKQEDPWNKDYTEYTDDYTGYTDYQYNYPNTDYQDTFDYSYSDPTYTQYSDKDHYRTSQQALHQTQQQTSHQTQHQTQYQTPQQTSHQTQYQTPQQTSHQTQYKTPQQTSEYQTQQSQHHTIPDNIEFYDPGIKVPDLPVKTYTEENTPWGEIHRGEADTRHLYRAFHT